MCNNWSLECSLIGFSSARNVGDLHFEDSWLLTMPKGGKAGGGKGGGKGASGGASKSGGGGKSKGKGDSTLESQVYSALRRYET